MGKTHQALSRAEKEHRMNYLKPVRRHTQQHLPMIPQKKDKEATAPVWFQELKTRIQNYAAGTPMKTIMFTGSALGEGTTTTASGFASIMAKNYELKVLLMDLNLRCPGSHEYFNSEDTHILSDLYTDNVSINTRYQDGSHGNLCVITCNGCHLDEVAFLGSNRFEEFLHTTRDKFDYIIFDAPPVALYSESRILSARADGVVLVLESGKSRRQVALKAKKEIEASGGNFIGVVLNKRRYFIPKWLYKRL